MLNSHNNCQQTANKNFKFNLNISFIIWETLLSMLYSFILLKKLVQTIIVTFQLNKSKKVKILIKIFKLLIIFKDLTNKTKL
jgi:hypothetical protein